jgi:hypothetical protein
MLIMWEHPDSSRTSWLRSYIPTPVVHHDSTNTSHHGQLASQRHRAMTKLPRQRHHAMANIALAALSPAGLGSAIASGTRQCRHQLNSVAPLPAGPGSVITSRTQHHHCHHDSISILHRSKVAPAAPSPTWLGSTIASMTWHLHRTVAKSPR